MAIKTNEILKQLRTQLAALDSIDAEQIAIGPVDPARLVGKPLVAIVEDEQRPERRDGGRTARIMRVLVAVAMRADAVKGDIDLQVNAVYEPIHAKLESLRDGLAGFFETCVEDGNGPTMDTVWDQQVIRVKSCWWDITFERSLAATE